MLWYSSFYVRAALCSYSIFGGLATLLHQRYPYETWTESAHQWGHAFMQFPTLEDYEIYCSNRPTSLRWITDDVSTPYIPELSIQKPQSTALSRPPRFHNPKIFFLPVFYPSMSNCFLIPFLIAMYVTKSHHAEQLETFREHFHPAIITFLMRLIFCTGQTISFPSIPNYRWIKNLVPGRAWRCPDHHIWTQTNPTELKITQMDGKSIYHGLNHPIGHACVTGP